LCIKSVNAQDTTFSMTRSTISDPRILYIIGQLGRGGAEQQFYYLLKYLRPNARVISLSSGGYWADPIRKLGLEVIELKRRGRGDLRRFLRIVQEIRQYQPDIIHIFLDGMYGLYGRLAAILTRHNGVIVGERGTPTFDPHWYIQARKLWLNRHVCYVIANSRSAYDYLVSKMDLPIYKAKFIPNGLEIARIVKESSEGANPLPIEWQDKPIVITVGGLSSPKAPDLFVRVARKVSSQNPHVRFVIVGDGELRASVETLRHEFGLQDMLLLAGHQYNVPRWLSASSIFLMTSRFEGTPNALMEAMSVGLPCVVTDVGGCRELVKDGETGYVVPSGDENSLVDRLSRLLHNAGLRQSMAAKGQAQIDLYSVNNMVSQYKEIYRSVVTR
jgi:glycosyltransferase involved in cell wall biosynthesis